MQCFRSFHTAERTIEGVEAAHMAGAEGQRLKAVLGAGPYLRLLVPVAQQPQHFPALKRGAVGLRELSRSRMREASRRWFFCLRLASLLTSAASPMNTRWPRSSAK